MRPVLDLVQRVRRGQPAQTAPKVTVRVLVIVRLTPFGQKTVLLASSTVKSAMLKPPCTAGRSGHGLMIGGVPGTGRSRSARVTQDDLALAADLVRGLSRRVADPDRVGDLEQAERRLAALSSRTLAEAVEDLMARPPRVREPAGT